MRFLAKINGQANAEKFVSYLVSRDISTQVERETPDSPDWEVWVRNEDRLNDARTLFKEFEANPSDEKYAAAVKDAEELLRKKRQKATSNAKLQKTSRDVFRRDLVAGKIPPVTMTLLILAVIVSLLTAFGDPAPSNTLGKTMMQELSFVSRADFKTSEGDPAASLEKFELWRAITPIFIHLNVLHILFNGIMLVSLGRLAERLEGTLKFTILVLLVAVLSNLLQGLLPEDLMGNPFFGGLSGVVYGLFGFVWIKTMLNPNLGIALAPSVVIILLGWLFLNIANAFGDTNLANMAHLGGLLAGSALAFLQSQVNTMSTNRSA